MILEEFTNLMESIVDKDFPIREFPIIYAMSMKLQVNEVDFDRHYSMIFPEFLEALCRVVDKASPVPPGEKHEDWNKNKRDEQSLSTKLENVIHILIKLITSTEFKYIKEKFPLPTKQQETGLYTFNTSLPFYNGHIIEIKAASQPLPISKIIF